MDGPRLIFLNDVIAFIIAESILYKYSSLLSNLSFLNCLLKGMIGRGDSCSAGLGKTTGARPYNKIHPLQMSTWIA